MMRRREFLATGAVMGLAVPAGPVTAEVRQHLGKPTLFVRGRAAPASFYAPTDCPGGRYSWEEAPRTTMKEFVAAGFRLFQLDLWLEECWTKPGPLSAELARKQIRGVLDLCPEAAVVLRWHLNAPPWWWEAHPDELTRYANGEFETPERTQPVRPLQDDLRRTPRGSLASEVWYADARAKTAELLKGLAATPEGDALAGLHVACGVYGEWHYWGFMRNEPDVSAPMQRRFTEWRKARGRAAAAVPGLEERRALDEGIFRDPQRREAVIDYYRRQQELVAERITGLCELVKKIWPRPLLTGKLFLEEMDQTPSWAWRNDVDTAFELKNLDLEAALPRRNVFESFTREATGLDLRPVSGQAFTQELGSAAGWREIFSACEAHVYSEGNDVIHAGAGLLVVHTKESGARRLRLRGGRVLAVEMPKLATWVFDAESGERLI